MSQESQGINASANGEASLPPQTAVPSAPPSTKTTDPLDTISVGRTSVIEVETGQVAPIPENSPIRRVKLSLSLGAVLIELRGRVLEAQLRGPENVVNPANPSDGYWLASTWRGLFSRAYSLHKDLLGDTKVNLAQYNLADDKPLYLTNRFDFVNIGLEDTQIKFGLAEKLRQALNFLTALYQRLDRVDTVLSQIFEGSPPVLTFDPDKMPPDRYNYLIKELTDLVDALITAWDNYVRERLFAESNIMLSARYGYAAGRALSEMSWNLTVKTAKYRQPGIKAKYADQTVLDNEIYGYWLEQFKPESVSYLQRQLIVLTNVLNEDYKNQHPTDHTPTEDDPHEILDLKSPKAAINAVIQSIDYWQKTVLEMSDRGIMQRTNQPTTGNPAEPVNSNPPSWSEKLVLHPSWHFDYLMDLRLALNEQQGNWFSLVAGREDLTSFRVLNVAGDLIQSYSREITHLATANLQDAFKQIQNELAELTRVGIDSVKGIADVGRDVLGNLLKNRWLVIGLVGAAVMIILVMVGLVLVKALDGPGFIASLVTPILGLFGIGGGLNKAVQDGTQRINTTENAGKDNIQDKSTRSQNTMAQSASISAMVLTAAGELRAYLEKAFANGYAQLQRELGMTSATLAATGPLIEFVVRNCDPNNDLDFLSKIAWNDEVRRNQRDRIVIAAFGPVGAFLVSSNTDPAALINVPQQEQQKAAQAQAASNYKVTL